jgi:hypothetical protein
MTSDGASGKWQRDQSITIQRKKETVWDGKTWQISFGNTMFYELENQSDVPPDADFKVCNYCSANKGRKLTAPKSCAACSQGTGPCQHNAGNDWIQCQGKGAFKECPAGMTDCTPTTTNTASVHMGRCDEQPLDCTPAPITDNAFSVPDNTCPRHVCVTGGDDRILGEYVEDIKDGQETSGDFLRDGVPRYVHAKCVAVPAGSFAEKETTTKLARRSER